MAADNDPATIAHLRGVEIELATEMARIGILPNLGGALTYYDINIAGHWHPILRRMSPRAVEPREAALMVLAPWSNRISGGGFHHDGQFHALKPNIDGEPYPIHGNAFQSVWLAETITNQSADLLLESRGPGPFRYAARLRYALSERDLSITLNLTHHGAQPLPYGAGFHPWFPRTPKTRLTASSGNVWLENADHLPAGQMAARDRMTWDFRTAKILPTSWINNCFTDWPGLARIDWPERRLCLDLVASDSLPYYLLYAPGLEYDFFCFEPVTHPVDAHNIADDRSLKVLANSEALSITVNLHPGII